MSNNRREFFRNLADPAKKMAQTIPQPIARHANLSEEQQVARFLGQATLGANQALINSVVATGIEAWLEAQFNVPQSEIYAYFSAELYDESSFLDGPWPERHLFRYALWDHMMNGADLVRQRVALALSEIIVISTETDELYNNANGVAVWYDMLLKHAFGNFRDLLYDVTLSPMMGSYLSHAGNRKSDPSVGRFPDENYAREVMQLFSIGLYYLNEDGTLQLDGGGQPIPTYDNSHITEFAKIFTGLGYDHVGDPHYDPGFVPPIHEGWMNPYVAVRPMRVDEGEHEPGAKTLLEGLTVPAGQSTLEDINMALDHLFWHQNVPPFISVRLIKFLVKSNPSPDYVWRVVQVFKDNGSGVRGDLKAVVRAILLDDEARNLSYITDPTNGRLREPFYRLVHLMRTFDYSNAQNRFWDAGWLIEREIRQYPLNPPSVFNFFAPGFAPAGPVAAAGLSGPEFQLLNSYTAISMINFWYAMLDWGYMFDVPDGNFEVKGEYPVHDQPTPDFSYLVSLVEANDLDTLLYILDNLLTYGTMSQASWTIIRDAVVGFATSNDYEDAKQVVQFAVYLFMISPEYNVQV